MIDPITEAKRLTPWWMMEIRRFDGLELHPVRDHHWDDEERGPRPFSIPDNHETWCEPCEADEAHFWSVYGHFVEGGIECFEDFPTEAAARRFAEQLLAAYPHLQRHGLMG